MHSYLAFIHTGIEAYSGNARNDGIKLAGDCITKIKALDPQDQFPPKLLILFASPEYLDLSKAEYLLLGINQTFTSTGYPAIPLIGCSAAAVFFDQRINEEGALLVCLASRLIKAEVAVGERAVVEPEAAVRDVLKTLKLDENRVDDPDPYASHTLLTLFPGYINESYMAPALHKLMRRNLSAPIRIFGGVACADYPDRVKPGLLFANDKAYNDALVVANLDCGTPVGVTFTQGLTDTGRLLRVTILSQDKRAIHRFHEGAAIDVIEQAEEGDRIALLAKISVHDDFEVYTPKRSEGDKFVRVSREVKDDSCFRVVRPDANEIRRTLRDRIKRTVKIIRAENPIACLALKCNGLLRNRHKIGLNLQEEFKIIEDDLNLHQNGVSPVYVGAFFDGEAGVDESGKSLIGNWGTAAMTFGDEMRDPTPIYSGFQQLADLAREHLAEPGETVKELLEMIYNIGFPGAMISYWIHDEPQDWIVAQDAVGSRYPKTLETTRRAVGGENVLPLVANEKKPRYVFDSRLQGSHCDAKAVKISGIISQYIYPLITFKGKVYAILQIDLGDLSYKKSLNPSEKRTLDGIGAIVSSILYRTFHWKEAQITRDLDQALKECMSAETREEGLQRYLEKVLEVFNLESGQIRVAREDREDLILIAGSGSYHKVSKKTRRKIAFGDVSPTARAFRENELVIVNNAAVNPAHQQMCGHWKERDEQLHKAMKDIGSYANIPFTCESGERGTIDLISDKPWVFTRYYEGVLEALGDRIAFLLDALKRKSREALILNAAPQLSEITGLDNPNKALDEAVKKFARAVKAEYASLFLWDIDLKKYILRAQYGWKDQNLVNAARYDKSGQWVGSVALHGIARHIFDLAGFYQRGGWSISGGSYNIELFGKELSENFTVEAIGIPLNLAGDELGVLILYRNIIPGQYKTGFLTTDIPSLQEAADRLSGLIGLLQHRIVDNRRNWESKRRNDIHEAITLQKDEVEFGELICSQIIDHYQANSVDFYIFEPMTSSGLTWKRGMYRESEIKPLRYSLPASDEWVEIIARNYHKLLENKQDIEIQIRRRQLTKAEMKYPKLGVVEGVVTFACLPLIAEGRLLGVMDIKWPRDDHRIYSFDYDFDRKEILTLGRTIGSAYQKNQIKEQKNSAEAGQEYAMNIRKEAEIEQQRAIEREGKASKQQQEAVQYTATRVISNLHRLGNVVINLRNYPEYINQADNPEKRKEVAKRIEAVIYRLRDTVNKIYETGYKIVDPIFEVCCLKDLLEKSLIEVRNPQINIDIPDERILEDIFLFADRSSINDVFVYLLKNAIEAVEKKTFKSQDIPKLEIPVIKMTDEKSVVITIKDNGVGMSEEKIKTILNGSISKEGQRGKGVPLSKSFLHFHNGRLDYKSEIGKGTNTIITLPLAQME